MIGTLKIQTVDGHWLDDDTVYTVRVSIDSWNGIEDDEDASIFYYTDGDPIEVGDIIASDFVITKIH